MARRSNREVKGRIHRYVLDNACAESIVPLLHPQGEIVRLYRHWPTPEIAWWRASVPLSRGGPNRNVRIQSLEYDLELSRKEFIEWIDEFSASGMTLLQSAGPLPGDLHPRRFSSPASFEQVLGQLGAMLLFELPHANETAGVTVFSDRHSEWVRSTEPRLRDSF